jgi:acyl-CoA reductase-like NAD-dependent aldehyde dehydrogenase
VLSRTAQLILAHEQEFVGWGIKETGGIAGKAAHEVHASSGELVAAAALGTEPYGQLAPTSPFGGMGASGNGGRYGGQANWEEFTQWQWLTVRETPAAYPF